MRKVTDENCLECNFPDVAAEWHPIKNGNLTPKDVTKCSTKKVWWKCNKCQYEWERTVHKRFRRGCPACAGQVVTSRNCLETNFPNISDEWHMVKNKSLTPRDVTQCSGKRAWWKCKCCAYEWISYICNRTSGKNGCPACAGHVVTNKNCLQIRFPCIAEEWHLIKNGNLTPKNFSYASNKKVWWKCKKCNYEWIGNISVRTRHGMGCPKCSHRVSLSGTKWLDKLKIPIENREIPIKIGNRLFQVDGYDPETNTVYEYFGNFWHGNPKKFKSNDINPITKTTYGFLYKKTMEKISLIEKDGYNIIYKWSD